jgi:hypothetical protein
LIRALRIKHIFDLSVTPINYVDFIGVDAILSNSSNQICDEIYMAEGNVLSKGEAPYDHLPELERKKLSVLSLRVFKFFQTFHTFRRRRRQCKRVSCRGLGIDIATMERRFSIEAKSFYFSIKEGFSYLRLEERRKKFVGFIFASSPCAAWLKDTMEVATQVKEDISNSYCEGDKVLIVHGGSNKAGRYLEVSVYVEGGRKGVLWIPKGRFGRG